MATIKKGSKGTAVAELQKRLKSLGFDPGGIDGIWGKKTQAAFDSFTASGQAGGPRGDIIREALNMNNSPMQSRTSSTKSSSGGSSGGGSSELNKLIAAVEAKIKAGEEASKNQVISGYDALVSKIAAEMERQNNQYNMTAEDLSTRQESSIDDMRANVDQSALRSGLARSSYYQNLSEEGEADIRSQVTRILAEAALARDTNVNELNTQQTQALKDKETTLMDIVREAEAESAYQKANLGWQGYLANRSAAASGGGSSRSSSGWSVEDLLNSWGKVSASASTNVDTSVKTPAYTPTSTPVKTQAQQNYQNSLKNNNLTDYIKSQKVKALLA